MGRWRATGWGEKKKCFMLHQQQQPQLNDIAQKINIYRVLRRRKNGKNTLWKFICLLTDTSFLIRRHAPPSLIFLSASLSSSSQPDIAPILNSYSRSEARWRRSTQPNDRTERSLSMNDQNCYGFFPSTLRANFWINFGTLQHLHNRSALFWILRSFSCRSSKSSCHYIWIIPNAKLFSCFFAFHRILFLVPMKNVCTMRRQFMMMVYLFN